MQDLYGLSPSLPNREETPEKTTIATSGSSPPPSLIVSQDIKMERTATDTKEEYQISTRSGGHYQRIIQKSLRQNATAAAKSPKSVTAPSNGNTGSINREQENHQNDHQHSSDDNSDVKNLATTDERSTPPRDESIGSGNISSNEESAESTSPNKYRCSICDTITDNENDYLNHIRQHDSGSPHLENPTDQQFTCSVCQKSFGSSMNLERHALLHSNNERPFRCKICSITFTTNGNLHRHMRTHSSGGNQSEYESDESTDSSSTSANHQQTQRKSQRMRRRFEYNNNNYNKRKVENIELNTEDQPSPTQHGRRRLKTVNNNTIDALTQKFHCPVCDREDFASLNVFETHLEEVHPEYQIKCEQCNLGFKNHRVLNLHRYMVHLSSNEIEADTQQKSIVGFKDLTFVDFSSEKFPIIAKAMCEKTLHRASNENDLNFQCQKCSRGFPCMSALEIHQQSCLKETNNYGSLSDDEQNQNNPKSEEDVKRSDFFAGLNLQNKTQKEEYEEMPFTPKIRLKECLAKPDFQLPATLNHMARLPIDTTKDLADIQSIISVTSAQSLLQQLTAPKSTPPPVTNIPLPFPMQITPPDSNPRPHLPSSSSQESHQEEEQQDQFAAEFRKMKLRGEFPCRLCTAVFPNLRALKGHNRAHLTGNGNGPYRCNMCPHSSTDKAALVRHMRTHNGDRPYECAVCNYAFTTKANCERHLRNRHRKVTREEVKRSIIYHPSEDPTNDETLATSLKGFTPPRRNDEFSKLHLMSEAKRALFTNSVPVADIPSTSSSIQIPDIRSVMSKISLPNPDLSPTLHLSNPPLSRMKDEPLNLPNIVKNNLNALKEHRIFPKLSSALNLSNDSHKDDLTLPLATPKIQVKNFNELKEIPEIDTPAKSEHTDSEPEDTYSTHSTLMSTPLSHFSREPRSTVAPIDLSMDVLDLSKKKREPTPEPEIQTHNHNEDSNDEPQDFTKKTLNQNLDGTPPPQPQVPTSFFEKTQLLLAQQLLKRGVAGAPPGIPPSFYASHLQNLYSARSPVPTSPLTTPPQFGNIPPFGLNPYFLQPHPFLTPSASPQDFQEMKERIQKEIIRGLQLSGGGLIMEHLASERLQAFQKQNEQKSEFSIKSEDKPLTVDTNDSFNLDSNLRSPVKQSSTVQKPTENIISHTPNSVKMVIKNGVLMPKQKQRRYRTERPFSCEHCSARFTLRSNMERHVKQQHPQFWSQRQRSNMSSGVPGRKPSLQILPSVQSQTQPNFDAQNLSLPKTLPNVSKDIPPSFSLANLNDLNKQPLLISDHVKFAILAQQLKQQLQNNSEPPKTNEPMTTEENTNENDDEEEENDTLVIDENSQQSNTNDVQKQTELEIPKNDHLPTVLPQQNEQRKTLEQKMTELRLIKEKLLEKQQQEYAEKVKEGIKVTEQTRDENHRNEDLVPVSKLLDNAAQIPFREYFRRDTEDTETPSEEDEEGLVASGSTSEGNISGSDGNRSECEANNAKANVAASNQPNSNQQPDVPVKKKSAYSLAPNRVTCPYCHRKFPWSSSLRRHILTHTGQKPFKCSHCPLLFTTKSNCDRHLLRKHGNLTNNNNNSNNNNPSNNTVNTTISTPNPSGNPTSQNSSNDLPPNVALPTNYMMRNVPERPFKCSNCPSSTFSTLSNLKKHMSCKHNDSTIIGLSTQKDERPIGGSIYDSHSSEDENAVSKVQVEKIIKNYQNDCWEQQINIAQNNNGDSNANITHMTTQTQTNTDLPFKCHLCDSSYGERQDALDHIKEQHTSEYELLMSKGALDSQQQSDHQSSNTQMDQTNSDEQLTDDQIHLRGKFPDYANRKVMCAFCMRRFWSAEDLRRHMRTHTGERPFSCDVCRRRFTLKHSMLRHRKKHKIADENFLAKNLMCVDNGTGEDAMRQNSSENEDNVKSNENNNNNIVSKSIAPRESEEREGGTDLISNLLGIRDSSIIDQVLRSSADDAAKLLGVNKANE